jgi:transducin beta-like protein 2
VLNLAAARATYGSGDGSTILISCSEGTGFVARYNTE